MTLPYKTKQFFVVLIKLSIVVIAFYFVYHKLNTNDELELSDFMTFLRKNDLFSIQNLIFLAFLTIFNWIFEILKWNHLVSSVISISFKNAAEQSLAALTASLLTPNRIGEYGAKAIYYPSTIRKKIMLLNLVGNMLQMGTTIIFGIIGLLFFINNYPLKLEYTKLALLFFFILIFSVGVYGLKKNWFEIKGFSMEKIYEFIKGIPFNIKSKAFIFSVVRYLIFSFQFYFLLQIFDVSITYFNGMMVITSIYFISSIIPSIFIFDVIIKGSVAVYLFSMVGVNDFTVLCVTTLMWLLNFVLPSVFGSYYVLNFNIPKVDDTI